ncbi:hypothetical protein EFP49_05530 [Lactobacillus johnsonii]|jgi:hypothetical protein|uniref:hypothetical protein n=1 Tax=Lactobacillus johnsonii TaxID=33959 RepID=UPI0021A640DD|nr:hypothetical protein [Lactobacillus johnsonii]MCT3342258.1 hypothetical protein [Lactobacillus johnsonii]
MNSIKENKNRDSNTEAWIVIALSVFFAFLVNRLVSYITHINSFYITFIVGIISMSIFSITYYHAKCRLKNYLNIGDKNHAKRFGKSIK